MPAAASPPTGSPPQYSPALRWVTTGFGMGPGGASALSATGTPDRSVSALGRLCAPTMLCIVPVATCCRAGRTGARSRRERGRATPAQPTTVRSALGHEHGSAPVGYPPSTCRLSTRSSAGGLTCSHSGETRLGEGFPLRCFQRFARPDVATQRCRLPDNWPTSGPSSPVLSY